MFFLASKRLRKIKRAKFISNMEFIGVIGPKFSKKAGRNEKPLVVWE